MKASKPANPKDAQSWIFISELHAEGWRTLTEFESSGHTFVLMTKTGTNRNILIQNYPAGHGFEVWRPVTDSPKIEDTKNAVQVWGSEPVDDLEFGQPKPKEVR